MRKIHRDLNKRYNEKNVDGVNHWQTYNDPNHNNHHMEWRGVELFRFPFSPYMGRVEQYSIYAYRGTLVKNKITNEYEYIFTVRIGEPNPKKVGDTVWINSFSSQSQEEVVKMAIDWLLDEKMK